MVRAMGVVVLLCVFGVGLWTPVQAQCDSSQPGCVAGCIDIDGLSIVTVVPGDDPVTPATETTVSKARALYDTHHPPASNPTEVVVMIPYTAALLADMAGGAGGLYLGTPKVAVAPSAASDEFAPGRGFSGRLPVMNQEFGHRWIGSGILGSINLLKPRVLASKTTKSPCSPPTAAACKGRLYDTTKSFCTSVWPGDRVSWSSKTRKILAVIDEHTLEFASTENGDTKSTETIATGTSYTIRSYDLVGRDKAHWTPFADMEGSYLDGEDLVDDPDCPDVFDLCADGYDPDFPLCSFQSLGEAFQFSRYDLYKMGLVKGDELPPLLVVKNPVDPLLKPEKIGNTWFGVSRWFTDPNDITYGYGPAYSPRNIRTRVILVTEPGVPVAPEDITRINQIRRDWITMFQLDATIPTATGSETRGTLTTHFSTTKPDLVVSKLEAPLASAPGSLCTVTALIHNQSPKKITKPVTVDVRAASDPSPVLDSVTLPGTLASASFDPHEIVTVELEFEMPLDLITDDGYGGSVELVVTVDPANTVTELDDVRNDRAIDVSVAMSAPPATTYGSVSAGPVTDNNFLYVARYETGVTGDGVIERITINDPLTPQVTAALPLGYPALGLANTSSYLFVSNTTEVQRFALPVSSTSTGETVLGPPTYSNNPFDIAIAGNVLYVLSFDNTIRVVTGINGPVSSVTSQTIDLPAGFVASRLRIAGDLLFVLGLGFVAYDISDRDSPVEHLQYDGNSVNDAAVSSDGEVIFAADETAGLLALDAVSGAQLAAWQDAPALSSTTAGELVLVHTPEHWVTLAYDSSGFTQVGQALLTAAAPGDVFSGHCFMRGWNVLATRTGPMLFSPTGLTDTFIRGDVNSSGAISIGDVSMFTPVINGNGTYAGVADAFDVNDDGTVTIADFVYITNYFNGAGPAPYAPFPSAATDTTSDSHTLVRPR